MKIAVLALVAAAAGLVAPGHRVAAVPTVPCGEHIQHTRFPYGGYRPVLGVVSAPPAYLQQIVPTGSRPWTYWRKAGLVVRTGSGTVTVSVPRAWWGRAAITWGNTGVVRALRIRRCPGTGGFAYAGGFSLREPSACVPLTFRAGDRSATVRFGLGRHCPGSE